MKNILVYGDSNTWGYIPTLKPYNGDDSTVDRYKENEMWWYPLKEGNHLIVNGNSGRTSTFDHPFYEGKNAYKTINDDLKNISKVDLLVIMLGTNDFKKVYNPNPIMIVNNLDKIIKIIVGKYNCEVLVVCPPQINYDTPITKVNFDSSVDWIKEYEIELKKYTKKNNYYFTSAIKCEIGVDGEHLTSSGHKLLGENVLKEVSKI